MHQRSQYHSWLAIVICCLFLVVSLLAQDGVPAHQRHFHEGEALLERGEWQAARAVFERALRAAEAIEGKESLEAALVHNALGEVSYHLADFDVAIDYFVRALRIRREQLEATHPDVSQALNNLGAACRRAGRFDEAEDYLRQALDLGLRSLARDDPELGSYYINFGVLAKDMGRYRQAIERYRQALAIFRQHGDRERRRIAIACNNIAVCYKILGDYDQALAHYHEAFSLMEEELGARHPSLATLVDNIGACYGAMNAWPEALRFHQKALTWRRERLLETHESIAASYHNIAVAFRGLRNSDSALVYALLAERSFEVSLGPTHPRTTHAAYIIGETLREKRRYEAAIEMLNRTLTKQAESLSDDHPWVLQTLVALGETWLKHGEPSKAGRYLEQALSILLPERRRQSMDHLTPTYPPLLFFRALHGVARVSERQGRSREALEDYRLMFQALESIRAGYHFDESKLQLAEQVRPYLEAGLDFLWRRYRQSEEQDLLDLAFSWMEQSKAFLLFEAALAGASPTAPGGVPEAWRQREQSLRADLVWHEKMIAEERQKGGGADQAALRRYQSRHLKIQQQYALLRDSMEKKYPDYFQSRFASAALSRRQAQSMLPDRETALLNYWVGDSAIFVVALWQDRAGLYAWPSNFPLAERIDQFRRAIYDPFLGERPVEARRDHARAGFELYECLLGPLPALPKRLIILPDGPLGYLPFACLLTAPATPGRPVPYLIHTHQVSYGWSASLLFRQARRGAPRGKRLLVMAPRFDSAPPGEPQFAGVRAEFGPLAHNEAEARAVHDLFGGNLFLGEEATEARFKALAPRYAYIHLSTHAKTYDESPLLSCLAFTAMAGDTTEDHRLQVAELYQLSLNAELVVLSACETGVGQLRRGEGIFGLARAFSYAGAQSLAATLWKVDDAAAAELMRAFYAYLKKGLPKDEALRQAQLDYLEQADPLHAHPFFWAGYTLFGRIDALETSSPINSGPIAAGLGLALVIVGAAWVWMRRARRSSPRL